MLERASKNQIPYPTAIIGVTRRTTKVLVRGRPFNDTLRLTGMSIPFLNPSPRSPSSILDMSKQPEGHARLQIHCGNECRKPELWKIFSPWVVTRGSWSKLQKSRTRGCCPTDSTYPHSSFKQYIIVYMSCSHQIAVNSLVRCQSSSASFSRAPEPGQLSPTYRNRPPLLARRPRPPIPYP